MTGAERRTFPTPTPTSHPPSSHAAIRHHRHRLRAGGPARRHSGGEVRPPGGGHRAARNRGRRLHQHRHDPLENHARSRAAPFRFPIPGHLWRELQGEGKDHHGRPGVPGQPGDQDGSGCHPGAAFAQRRFRDQRARQFPRCHACPHRKFPRPGRSGSAHCHHRHRHQAGRFAHRTAQRPHHRQ